jgi:hypothetical protein
MENATAEPRGAARLLRRAVELGPREAAVRAARLAQHTLLRKFPDVRIARTARLIQQRTGKPVAEQLREIIALRRGPGRLSPADYYAYELYDDRRFTFAQKQEYVGWEPPLLSGRFNDPNWREICDDKLITYAVLRGLCLPHPQVYAVFHPRGRTYGPVPSFDTPEALAGFLRDGMPYPFFAKPAKDAFGVGASSVTAIDRGRDILVLHSGEEVGVDDYVRRVPAALGVGHRLVRFGSPYHYDSGYLFQERIVWHPVVERLTGGRSNSLRLVVLVGPNGPQLFRATWKVAVGSNVTDHLARRSQNLKCPLDRVTGEVKSTVQGRGPVDTDAYGLGYQGREIDVHPDTRERLTGVTLPDWDKAVTLCLHAAAAFPGLRYQAWDIALTANGPIILELNYTGGTGQIPGWPGLNDAEFRQFWASAGST